MNLKCLFCGYPILKHTWLKHLWMYHRNDPDFKVMCNVQGCPQTFTSYSALKSHIQRKHKGKEPTPVQTNVPNPDLNVHHVDDVVPSANEGCVESVADETEGNCCPPDLSKKLAAKLILKLRSGCVFSGTALQTVLREMEGMVENSLGSLVKEIDSALATRDIKLSDHVDVSGTISRLSNCFDGLSTEFLQNNFWKKEFKLIMPVQHVLGGELSRTRPCTDRKTVLKNDVVIYVPIIDTLKTVTRDPQYQKLLNLSAIDPNPDVIDSYEKGSNYAYNGLLQEHSNCVQLILYYDDLEVCDPLGSKAGKQKLGVFYFSVNNVPAMFRSALDMIYIAAVVKSSLIKKYGMTGVMQPLVRDLKTLESGVKLENDKILYATVIAVTGDNLGSHAVGGFKEGFTAFRSCRHCMVSRNELHKSYHEDEKLLRSKSDHEKQAQEILIDSEASKLYGLNFDSPLNTLQYFHVTNGLPCDVMHDLLEGVLPLTLRNLLNVILEQTNLTLDIINAKLKEFDYGYSEVASIPTAIKWVKKPGDEKKQLVFKENSSQMWLLSVMLPLIVGPTVPDEMPEWNNYILLLEICSIVFSPKISSPLIAYLVSLTEEYLCSFVELYKKNLTPKQHFLLHYPTLLSRFGPLVNFWCMRMEGKHKSLKNIVRSLGNYKNIPWTVTFRQQLHQTYVMQGSWTKTDDYGPAKVVLPQNLPYYHVLPHDMRTANLYEMVWTSRNGMKYCRNRCYILLKNVDNLPCFGLLINILKCEERVIFVVQNTRTVEHDLHLYAYLIEDLNTYECVRPDHTGHAVYHAHVVSDKKYLIMKYCAGDLH